MKKYTDCHCHVFNRNETINLRLIIQIILSLPDILAKEDENQAKFSLIGSILDKIQSKINFLKRLINFLKTGTSDSEDDIYKLMETVYNGNFNIVPLMFDLECCFIKNRTTGKEMLTSVPLVIYPQFEDFINNFNKK
jgi:hypothetical protein